MATASLRASRPHPRACPAPVPAAAETWIVIPARRASQRFPGKPLALVRGASGQARPVIERSWQAARAGARLLPGGARVVIATDDAEIAQVAHRFGAQVALTPRDCANGTERCAMVLAQWGASPGLVVNLQGDAPLTPPHVIAALVARMRADPLLPAATPALPSGPATGAGATFVQVSKAGDAVAFWRAAPDDPASAVPDIHRHLGAYAYRPAALAAYAKNPPCAAELRDGLEQWRFLAAGTRLGVALCAAPGWDPVECNHPSDIPAIEAVLAARGLA